MNKHEMAEKMVQLAQSLPAGSDRAQAYSIAQNIKIYKTLAGAAMNTHANIGHAKRHCHLFVSAELAKEVKPDPAYFGTFKFIDGSEL